MTKKEYDFKLIHKRLKELRLSKTTEDNKILSQMDLSRMTGIAHSRISRLENEFSTMLPSPTELLVYRNFFNVSTDYILGFSDEKSTDEHNISLFNECGITNKSFENLSTIMKKSLIKDNELSKKRKISALNNLLSYGRLDSFLLAFEKYISFNPTAEKTYLIPMEDLISSEENLSNDDLNKMLRYTMITTDTNFIDEYLLKDLNEHLKNIKEIFQTHSTKIGFNSSLINKKVDLLIHGPEYVSNTNETFSNNLKEVKRMSLDMRISQARNTRHRNNTNIDDQVILSNQYEEKE